MFEGKTGISLLSVAELEQGTLPEAQILFLPEYYQIDEDMVPADLSAMLVGVAEVCAPELDRLPDGVFYYNFWPAPNAKLSVLEVVAQPNVLALLQDVLGRLDIGVVAAPATPGMIAPRVVAMIINEAHLLLQEGAASAADIDLSMKLGTGYPLGPFEWEALVGVERVRALLGAMAEREPEVIVPYWTVGSN